MIIIIVDNARAGSYVIPPVLQDAYVEKDNGNDSEVGSETAVDHHSGWFKSKYMNL